MGDKTFTELGNRLRQEEKRQTVLITGIAGSLGKAFTRRLRKECDIIGIDHNEWAVAEFTQEFPDVPVMLKDFDKWRYNQCPADILIHCAAYKHVNLGEENPHTFIENNVEKTGKLFAEAYKYNTQILFISTDKAVEPISTYGFTKALGEKLARHYEGSVARLGNIFASTGSVIPAWEKAIKELQPIPITDERMVRYAIDEGEAVDEIWKGFMAGEKLIIPSMGEPIRIMDMLEYVLKQHHYNEASAYPGGVTVVGMRSGEKIKEVLRWPWEEK